MAAASDVHTTEIVDGREDCMISCSCIFLFDYHVLLVLFAHKIRPMLLIGMGSIASEDICEACKIAVHDMRRRTCKIFDCFRLQTPARSN